MKYLLINAMLLLFSTSFAQTQQTDSLHIINVEKQGSIMAKLFLANDYEGFVEYTYQPLIDLVGGKEKVIQIIEQAVDKIAIDGFYITNCSVEKPKNIIRHKNDLQCTIIQNLEMKTSTGRLVSTSTLIGISNDNGENWTFIETSGKNLKTLQSTFKDLSDNLVIPIETKPTFYRD